MKYSLLFLLGGGLIQAATMTLPLTLFEGRAVEVSSYHAYGAYKYATWDIRGSYGFGLRGVLSGNYNESFHFDATLCVSNCSGVIVEHDLLPEPYMIVEWFSLSDGIRLRPHNGTDIYEIPLKTKYGSSSVVLETGNLYGFPSGSMTTTYTFALVPEPSTFAVSGLGLAAFLWRLRVRYQRYQRYS